MKGPGAPLVRDVLGDYTPREGARSVGNMRSGTADAQGFTRVAQSAPLVPVSPAPGQGGAGEEMRSDEPDEEWLDVAFPCHVVRSHTAAVLEQSRGRGRMLHAPN